MPIRDPEKQREYQRAWYQRNKASQKAKARAWTKVQRAAIKKMIDDYKSQHPCSDCAQQYPPVVMEFDHVASRGKKRDNISDLVRRCVSFKTLLTEMEKCDLVCANCHRIRTFGRRIKKKEEKDNGDHSKQAE